MNTDTRQQIETALRAFSGADLRAASIGLLNTLGYQSEKTLDLDHTPDAFLAEFDKRDRKFRKDKALFERWKSVEFLFQIADDEVRNAGAQGTLFDSGYRAKRTPCHMRFGNNQMDKLNLPVPEDGGPPEYEGKTLLFKRVSSNRFQLSVRSRAAASRWKSKSRNQGTLFEMRSGREYGVFS